MKTSLHRFFRTSVTLLIFLFFSFSLLAELKPPLAQKIPFSCHVLHQDQRCDNYYWLREKNNPAVVDYLLAWNTYTENWMDQTKDLQETLYQEMSARLGEDTTTFPFLIGNYLYYRRIVKEKDYSIYCRKKNSMGSSEEVILDSNEWAPKFNYFKVKNWVPSTDGRYIGFAIDTEGTQYCTLVIKDCLSGQFLEEEKISLAPMDLIWDSKGEGFWYLGIDSVFRENKVFYHRIGTSPLQDICIFEENEPTCVVEISGSNDQRFLFVYSINKTSSEGYYGLLSDPNAPLKLIQKRKFDLLYYVEAHEDAFYFKAKKGCENNGIHRTSITRPTLENWQTYLKPQQKNQIVDFALFKNALVLTLLENGLIDIQIHSLIDDQIYHISFPDALYSASLDSHQVYNSSLIRILYSSPVTPDSLYTFDIQTKQLTLVERLQVSNFNASKYRVERIKVVAEDGALIPLSLFYKKDARQNHNAPLLLNGYGAYETTFDCPFSFKLLSLIDRGVIYAYAHVRGGGEKGWMWYEEGRLLNKKNTFSDFISCAEYLIKEGYTTSDKLVIEGRSAGGLLMGAVTNQRPELFKAVIAEVPFVDVLTTMSDRTIPLTSQEEEEWGCPLIKEHYDYMKTYSPYDNVKKTNYPSLFITAGFNDAQVAYWEPAKWVAKLLEYKTDDNPLLFKTNMQAGHHSSSGRYTKMRETAFKYAFILNQVGINQ